MHKVVFGMLAYYTCPQCGHSEIRNVSDGEICPVCGETMSYAFDSTDNVTSNDNGKETVNG